MLTLLVSYLIFQLAMDVDRWLNSHNNDKTRGVLR